MNRNEGTEREEERGNIKYEKGVKEGEGQEERERERRKDPEISDCYYTT